MLTQNKDIDMLILNYLEDSDLKSFYFLNDDYIKKILNNEYFWLNRILYRFSYIGIDILKIFKQNSWKDYYLYDLRLVDDNPKILIRDCEEGRLDRVMLAIEKGANFKNTDALAAASYGDKINVIKYLLEKGADIHFGEDLALNFAAMAGNINTMKYLLKNGALIAPETLRLACTNQNLNVVKFLSKRYNIHIKDDMLLKVVSALGFLEIVKFLVETGANIHAENEQPLYNACINGHLSVVKYLLEQGANKYRLDYDDINRIVDPAILYELDTN